MDLRLMAIVMAFAIIMDIVGRMARKRAAEQQPEVPTEEGWLQALSEADELPDKLLSEALPRARTKLQDAPESDPEPVASVDLPGPASATPRFDPFLWPEPVEPERTIPERAAPHRVTPEPTRILPLPVPARAPVEPEPWELPLRDRTARPIEVRSRAPRTVDRESRPERPAREIERTTHPDVDTAYSRRGRAFDVAGQLGLTDVRGLRRIVVAREVLGPPLALRDDDRRAGGQRS